MRISLSIAITLTGTALLVACADHDITSAASDAVRSDSKAEAGAMQIADVSGTWNWNNVEEVSFPPFLAALLGVVPEGELTHGICESSGTMTLVQSGTTFDGTAEKDFNACFTRGGQPFNQPAVFFSITDGRVTGRAVHFSLSSPTVGPCPHHATISSLEQGTAVALSGKGMCFLPGHPQSESPLQIDPPPQGRSRTTLFEAVRP